LVGEASEPETPDSPGLVILDRLWQAVSTTPGTERWLADLPGEYAETGRLPSALVALAGRARAAAEDPDRPSGITVARVPTASGTWAVLHGARLEEQGEPRVAVIIELAHPARLYPLLMAAYQLTEREQDVTRAVLHGRSTTQIARELRMSPHTVQQHLKSVFDKTGVRSRAELQGRIFFSHYEPRFRDNEHRVRHDRPMRGGPVGGGAGP
jgi:DNA-binding CsgD family transcriptional regulator